MICTFDGTSFWGCFLCGNCIDYAGGIVYNGGGNFRDDIINQPIIHILFGEINGKMYSYITAKISNIPNPQDSLIKYLNDLIHIPRDEFLNPTEQLNVLCRKYLCEDYSYGELLDLSKKHEDNNLFYDAIPLDSEYALYITSDIQVLHILPFSLSATKVMPWYYISEYKASIGNSNGINCKEIFDDFCNLGTLQFYLKYTQNIVLNKKNIKVKMLKKGIYSINDIVTLYHTDSVYLKDKKTDVLKMFSDRGWSDSELLRDLINMNMLKYNKKYRAYWGG